MSLTGITISTHDGISAGSETTRTHCNAPVEDMQPSISDSCSRDTASRPMKGLSITSKRGEEANTRAHQKLSQFPRSKGRSDGGKAEELPFPSDKASNIALATDAVKQFPPTAIILRRTSSTFAGNTFPGNRPVNRCPGTICNRLGAFHLKGRRQTFPPRPASAPDGRAEYRPARFSLHR